MLSRARTHVRKWIAGGLAALFVVGALTLCVCAPERQAAGCQGCCTPATRASLESATNCCRVIEGSIPLSSMIEHPPAVIAADSTVSLVDSSASDRAAAALASTHGAVVDLPPLVLRI
jgi:hypothetical protein